MKINLIEKIKIIFRFRLIIFLKKMLILILILIKYKKYGLRKIDKRELFKRRNNWQRLWLKWISLISFREIPRKR